MTKTFTTIFQRSPFELERFKDWILRTLNATQSHIGPLNASNLTIGLEHEFFLFGTSGDPATHFEGQNFLKTLSETPGWYIRETSNGLLGPMIERVSVDLPSNRYTTIKYDHHPHLFEIAFAHTSSLLEQSIQVHEVISIIKKVSKKLGLTMGDSSTLKISPLDPKVVSPLQSFQELRHYRAKLLGHGSTPIDLRQSNYAAVIAATQTHIGGTLWWKNVGLIESLYSLESDIVPILQRTPPVQRWEGYLAVFLNFPLVGFPNLDEWSLHSWTEALFKSPLLGPTNASWSGSSLESLYEFPFKDSQSPWAAFMKSVRDLQIIRPKIFGTLEFRGDPAQNSHDSIMFVAALRLGLCASLLNNPPKIEKRFSEYSKQWRETVKLTTMVPQNSVNSKKILKLAAEGLNKRGFGEEKFLFSVASKFSEQRGLE